MPVQSRPDRSWGVTGADPLGDLIRLPPTFGAAGWFMATYADRLRLWVDVTPARWLPDSFRVEGATWSEVAELLEYIEDAIYWPSFEEFINILENWAPAVHLWRRSLERGADGWLLRRIRQGAFEAARLWRGRGWVWAAGPVSGASGLDPEDRNTWAVNFRLELPAERPEGTGPAHWVAVALLELALTEFIADFVFVPEVQDGRFCLHFGVNRDTTTLTEAVAAQLFNEILDTYRPPVRGLCARPGCGRRITGRAPNARYCSDRCAAADRQARRRKKGPHGIMLG